MATQNSTLGFIQSLGIKNFVHRQKLQLKALDLVLFGFQDLGSPWKVHLVIEKAQKVIGSLAGHRFGSIARRPSDPSDHIQGPQKPIEA